MASRMLSLLDLHFPPDTDSEFDESSITDSDVVHEIDNYIHRAEVQAYATVLRAFIYKTNYLDQDKQNLIISLMNELEISNDDHNEILAEIKDDDMIHLIREWKSFDKFSPERSIKSPFPTVSASEPDQPLSSLSSVKSVQDPSVEPAKAASLDPLIGKKVSTKWSADGPFIDGDITEYDSVKGMYKVIYAANTPKEFCEWIDLKKVFPEDIDWEGFDQVLGPVEENGQDSDNDNAEEKDQQAHDNGNSSLSDTSNGNNEKVKKSVKKVTMCTQTQMRPAKPESKSKQNFKSEKKCIKSDPAREETIFSSKKLQL